ncbi:MAG: hypothetical protein HND27_00355 [Bacteroidetes bacterium]|nr:hypothetical protein [Bacteroidota bacterium]
MVKQEKLFSCFFYFLKLIFSFHVSFLLISCNQADSKKQNDFESLSSHKTKEIDCSLFKSGDIILKKGNGMISSQIANVLNEPIPFSHCGIFIKTDTGNIIIQSVAKEINGKDGVQFTPYSEFIKDINYPHFYVVRLKNEKLHHSFIEGANEKLLEKVPFDYDFDYTDNSRIYCTELLYIILKEKCNVDVFKTKKVQKNEFLLFNSLLDNNTFEIVFHL